LWSSMGLYALAGILQWHLERKINLQIAVLLLLSAVLLMWTPFPIYYHVAGAVILFTIIILQNRQKSVPVITT
ncbi:MAG: hypothetical protein VX881_00015, partial [Pseudomonadota bacterium]|nr:hypothetical protein [Pseudomonadota bacterium]